MSHQYEEGWFPECKLCGCGNIGKYIICLHCWHMKFGESSAKLLEFRKKFKEDFEEDIRTHEGIVYKRCLNCGCLIDTRPVAETQAIDIFCGHLEKGRQIHAHISQSFWGV